MTRKTRSVTNAFASYRLFAGTYLLAFICLSPGSKWQHVVDKWKHLGFLKNFYFDES